MIEPLDSESVVHALTEGIGATFGSATRKSFRQQLDRLRSSPWFRDCLPGEQQSLVDLLAVASFYQTVIAPVESSGNFVSVLEKAGASHLRVATEKLDRSYASRAWATERSFTTLLQLSRIPPHLLRYATMKEFVINAREFFEGPKQ
jgi:hypothetical protein